MWSAGADGHCAGPDGVIAQGTVSASGAPLEGVRVSDGLHVVTTDSSGFFELPLEAESGPFLFVTTPHGYWADRFWMPVRTSWRSMGVASSVMGLV